MLKMISNIFLLLYFTCLSTYAEDPLPVALITNTKLEIDEIQKATPAPFILKQLKTKVAPRDNSEYYQLENQSKIDFEIIQKYRFDQIPKILNAIKTDLKTEILFILQNQINIVVQPDGSQNCVVKLQLISVDLNVNNTIDILEEAKLFNTNDPAQIEPKTAETIKSIYGILMKKSSGDFLKKINRRLKRPNPFLPVGIVSFYGLSKEEFETRQNDFKSFVTDTLKANPDSIAFQYNEKEKEALMKFNSLYESNDQLYLFRKTLNEKNVAFLNAFNLTYSATKLTPIFRRANNLKLIVQCNDPQKCEDFCQEILLKLKKDNKELDVFWLDNPKTQPIVKADFNLLKPTDFATYGNLTIKNQTTQDIKEWLQKSSFKIKEIETPYNVVYANEACILIEIK